MKHVFNFLSLWTVFAGFSGCVVKERDYPHHHHHDKVYVEPEVVEEKVIVR